MEINEICIAYGQGFDKQDVCTKVINHSINEFYCTGLQRFHSFYTVKVVDKHLQSVPIND